MNHSLVCRKSKRGRLELAGLVSAVLLVTAVVPIGGCAGKSNRSPGDAPDGRQGGGTSKAGDAGRGSTNGDGGADAAGGLGGEPPSSAAGGQAGALAEAFAGNGLGGNPAAPLEAAVCKQFSELWLLRSKELAPGEPLPPDDAEAPCYDCITQHESQSACGLPTGNCAAFTACARRHCLCQTASEDCEPNADPCACLSACGDGTCEQEWNQYMGCTNDACAAICR